MISMYINPTEYIPGTIANLKTQQPPQGNRGTKSKVKYKDCICAFDIETSRLPDIEQSVMYVWMFQIHHHCTVVGRTWEELRRFFAVLRSELNGETLCIYVHNLSYEFQFLRAIIEWQTEDVFAVDSRKVLKATCYDGAFEFRCSYLQTNMSLAEFTKKFHVEHGKLSGEEYDYKKIRYPWTELSERELEYCTHDVIGLCEALETEMKLDSDTLYTIPLTSTGYVRRDAKKAMRKVHHLYVKDQLPDYDVYTLLREAFRGGNTHANRYFSGHILKNVKSYDRSSSYPEVICNGLFPVNNFCRVPEPTEKELRYRMTKLKQALLMRVCFRRIKLKDKYWGCPYLSRDKSRNVAGGVFDNGRILEAEYLETTITDIDWKIIESEYCWEDFYITELYYAHYGKLPKPFVDTVIEYYRQKTELKNVPGMDVYYVKAKNLLNSLYGMMAQDPVKESTLFNAQNEVNWSTDTSKTPEELLATYNGKAFLAYQWGVWVTALSRYELELGMQVAGDDFVYCDTDSVKFIGEHDFTAYNKNKVEASTKSGARATDPQGVEHYMGVYEQDEIYETFATLGAKKYAFTLPPKIKNGVNVHAGTQVTIAGVTKRLGGIELDEHGGLKAFVEEHPVYRSDGSVARMEGFTFVKAGGTESVWNDNPPMKTIEREGRKLDIYPNVVIRDSTYTLGITAEYKSILDSSVLPLDFWAGL